MAVPGFVAHVPPILAIMAREEASSFDITSNGSGNAMAAHSLTDPETSSRTPNEYSRVRAPSEISRAKRPPAPTGH